MKIENHEHNKIRFMKKNFQKMLNSALKKYKHYHRQIKKLNLSSIKEDFVITEQEEREGGFFGSNNYKIVTT